MSLPIFLVKHLRSLKKQAYFYICFGICWKKANAHQLDQVQQPNPIVYVHTSSRVSPSQSIVFPTFFSHIQLTDMD